MKKTILTIAIAAFATFSSFAQGFDITAGYALTSRTLNTSLFKTSRASNGFFAGVGYDIVVGEPIEIVAALLYNYSQCNSVSPLWTSEGTTIKLTGNETEHYLELPLHVAFAPELSKESKVSIEIGPDFSYGLASKYKITASIPGYAVGDFIDQYKEYDYSRFDVLISGQLGYQLRNVKLFGGYKYGCVNRTKLEGCKLHRKQLFFGVSLFF